MYLLSFLKSCWGYGAPSLLSAWGLPPFAAGAPLLTPASDDAKPDLGRNVWVPDMVVNEEFKLVLITKQTLNHR